MRKSALIVAGGIGTRMGADIPKQFIEINKKPLMVYTIEAFLRFDPSIQIVLVLPEDHQTEWKRMEQTYFSNQHFPIAKGGETRFQSVKSGLEKVEGELVAIHDAVRPMVSEQAISASFESASVKGSGVLMVPLKDSIRMMSGELTEAKNRADYVLVQTPQTFQSELIKKAYNREELDSFSDDASVFEASGHQVVMVQGEYKNIKITTPEDLILAEQYLR